MPISSGARAGMDLWSSSLQIDSIGLCEAMPITQSIKVARRLKRYHKRSVAVWHLGFERKLHQSYRDNPAFSVHKDCHCVSRSDHFQWPWPPWDVSMGCI